MLPPQPEVCRAQTFCQVLKSEAVDQQESRKSWQESVKCIVRCLPQYGPLLLTWRAQEFLRKAQAVWEVDSINM